MLVADTNVIAYVYLPTENTLAAERLLATDPIWAAPILWRSELRNVLALYLRKKLLTFDQAWAIQTEAESLLAEHEYEVASYDVLQLAQESGCASYDCEFIALARRLDAKLVTVDKKLIKAFPKIAVPLVEAVRTK